MVTLTSLLPFFLLQILLLLLLQHLILLLLLLVWSFTDGDLRLAGVGASPLLGRLEVYYNGNWGSVCGGEGTTSGNFNLDSAHAACRQMGLGFAVNYFSALNLPEYR